MLTRWEEERNRKIKEAMKRFNEEMLREPGAKERCQKYLEQLGKECGFYWDEAGNIHYVFDE